MDLQNQIMSDIKTAMKSRDQLRLETLRFLNAAIKNKIIEVRPKEIQESDVQAVIKKLVKQRKDSIDQFQKADRKDLVDKETAELKILSTYLPEPMSEDKVVAAVSDAIKKLNATSMKEMGAVIKEVMSQTQGQADGKFVSTLVKSKLGN